MAILRGKTLTGLLGKRRLALSVRGEKKKKEGAKKKIDPYLRREGGGGGGDLVGEHGREPAGPRREGEKHASFTLGKERGHRGLRIIGEGGRMPDVATGGGGISRQGGGKRERRNCACILLAKRNSANPHSFTEGRERGEGGAFIFSFREKGKSRAVDRASTLFCPSQREGPPTWERRTSLLPALISKKGGKKSREREL